MQRNMLAMVIVVAAVVAIAAEPTGSTPTGSTPKSSEPDLSFVPSYKNEEEFISKLPNRHFIKDMTTVKSGETSLTQVKSSFNGKATWKCICHIEFPGIDKQGKPAVRDCEWKMKECNYLCPKGATFLKCNAKEVNRKAAETKELKVKAAKEKKRNRRAAMAAMRNRKDEWVADADAEMELKDQAPMHMVEDDEELMQAQTKVEAPQFNKCKCTLAVNGEECYYKLTHCKFHCAGTGFFGCTTKKTPAAKPAKK